MSQRRRASPWIALGMALACGLATSTPAKAGNSLDRVAPPIRKLFRGLDNAIGGPLELPVTMHDVAGDKGPIAGATIGLVLGCVTALKRSASGLVELVTFPFPYPKADYAPMMDPEFVLQPTSAEKPE